MVVEETKHDLWLKRIQITVAILAGLATLILGIYNVKKNIFSKKDSVETPQVVVQRPQESPIKSALEDAGASWIKKLGKAAETSQK